MVHALVIFLITSLISFIGSIELGPVNLVIIKEVLQGKWRAALVIGFGICVPQLFYSFIALYAAAWFLTHETLLKILEWSIVPILLAFGIYNFLKKVSKNTDDLSEKQSKAQSGSSFMKGFLISTMNPQVLPFWLAVLVMLNGYVFFRISTVGEELAFVLGAGFGELVILSLIIWLTNKYKEFLLRKMKKWNLNKVFGGLFILLAVIQTIKLFIHPKK